MSVFIRNKRYTGPLQGAILDWAGTAVDYGCMGPADVFLKVFNEININVTVAEARQFMGLMKKDHIRGMCNLPSVVAQWVSQHGRKPDESDVEKLYERTESLMVGAIADNAELIPGVHEAVQGMRDRALSIGSCTGYTTSMMDVLVPIAKEKGYSPDAVVCSSDVPAGRPYPWMCYLLAMKMDIHPMESMVKIGDTLSDIQEGLNAGMWTIGLTKSGNELGLTEAEVNALDLTDLHSRLKAIEANYSEVGSHYIVEGIWDCLPIIDDINNRLAKGEHPMDQLGK
ncbi:Phosphonoacetaldehyde hydrolase [Desulfamplus magnetovallimortis]|uniref:Phosphonoacetaldehyde hydrolase n=1 Tax=Desulfamplus magnetovallimortis TaxID=1246637 RepID=A0A1W1HK72_9BACT|nr:phosphonoacetaldehyde hydrolase [Desulfamplus magnetovallimortis]SLM32917.1 Phosphonoacetaldehyde hydrolase [Desulfamplus magnetovallimortis]